VYKYISDLKSYFEELTGGTFVAHTLEGVLLDTEGKQLCAEALYLYGCMLMLLDVRIAGPCRERLVVAYYRYKGAGTIESIDAVVKLCRATGRCAICRVFMFCSFV
jgi:WASH complex subunit strumpellin